MLARMPDVFDFIGLTELPPRDRRLLSRMMYEELELLVGTRLANQLTKSQLRDFEEIIDYLSTHTVPRNQDPSFLWLQEVAPNYRVVVFQCVFLMVDQLCGSVERIARIAEIELCGRRRSAQDVWDYLTDTGSELPAIDA